MQDVCFDDGGATVWKFEPESLKYVRFDQDAKMTAQIFGRYLPDPDMLWDGRLSQTDLARNSTVGKKLKPTAATYALWNHWQKAMA